MSPQGAIVESQLDPNKAVFVFVCGRKGTGKTELAKTLARSYPYDRLVIDPTHDIDDLDLDPERPEWEDLDELPSTFPGPDDDHERRRSLRYLPDPGSDTYDDDLDRAVGLAFFNPRRRTFLLCDEIAELTTPNRTGPHMRRALNQGRHRNLTMVMCGPRPKTINPLCISQADYVYVFQMPHPLDQEVVAHNIGWSPKDFQAKVNALGEHEYLRYDAVAAELTHWPPLPIAAARKRRSTRVSPR